MLSVRVSYGLNVVYTFCLRVNSETHRRLAFSLFTILILYGVRRVIHERFSIKILVCCFTGEIPEVMKSGAYKGFLRHTNNISVQK